MATMDLRKLVVVIISSITVFIQAVVQEKKTGWTGIWFLALFISFASITISMATFALETKKKEGSRHIPVMVLALLWALGCALLTMAKPFHLTGNGYFAIWAATLSSWGVAVVEVPWFKDPYETITCDMNGGPALGVLLVSSFVTFIQTAWSCGTVTHWCNGNAAWILVCSGVSTVFCGALAGSQIADKLRPYLKCISLFFLCWWAAGAVITTFEAPYESTYANGYFSCWVAVTAALLLVDHCWNIGVSTTPLERVSQVAGGAPPEILVLFLASLVTMIAASIDCGDNGCHGREVWAMICSTGSVIVSFLLIFHTIRGGWLTAGTVTQRTAIVLLAWWTIGTVCMTFVGPFRRLGNGYFASWSAFAAVCLFAKNNVEVLGRFAGDIGTNGREIGVIIVSSAVLFLQSVLDLANGSSGDEGSRGWAITCSLISLLACIGVAKMYKELAAHFKFITIGMIVWWTFGVGALTFRGPYIRTGNAYFASWCAWIASAWLLTEQYPQLKGYRSFSAFTDDCAEPQGDSGVSADVVADFATKPIDTEMEVHASGAPTAMTFGKMDDELDVEAPPVAIADDYEEEGTNAAPVFGDDPSVGVAAPESTV